MGFSIVKAAPDAEPVTIAEAKAQCEVDYDDRDEWFAERVAAARQLVETHTNRVFANCSVTFTLDDFPRKECELTDGIPAIRLPLPATSVTSVKYYSTAGTLTTLTATTQYLTHLTRVPSLIYPTPGVTWPTVQFQRMGGVEVVFVAGAEAKCELAKAAMLLIIGYWWRVRDDDDQTKGEQVQAGIPPAALRIMNGLTRPMYT